MPRNVIRGGIPLAAPTINIILVNGKDTNATINTGSTGNDVVVSGSNLLGSSLSLSSPGFTFSSIANSFNTSTLAAWTFSASGSASSPPQSLNVTLCNGGDCSSGLVPIADGL
jgi:hypothetical protein